MINIIVKWHSLSADYGHAFQSIIMLKNYFKTAWRTIARSKGYSALNIFGLAIGMAVALLIGLWAYNEYSYDKFLPDYQRLYLVRRNYYGNGDTVNYGGSSLKLADALRKVPEIQYVAETDFLKQHGLKTGETKLYEQGTFVPRDFLKMFGFPLVRGDAATMLSDPYSIVLTESLAKALFGTEDPINKPVRLDDKDNLKVTGILKDLPANSNFQFRYLMPFSYLEATDDFTRTARHRNFEWNGFVTFVKLQPGVSFDRVSAKIRDIEKVDKDNIMSVVTNVILQPLQDMHLHNNYVNGKEAGGLIDYVRMFGIIGVLVLLIACINFVNLSTARSEKRAREVGVRKAIGSQKKDLVFQFLTESFLLTTIAFFFTLLFVQLALPAFNLLTGSRIAIPFSSGAFWLVLAAGVVATTLAAGSRPAFYLSSFKPVKVLKGGTLAMGRAAALPRKILVVLQFSCSVALIIATFVIYQQIQYARNRPVGYNIHRLMMTNMNSDLAGNYTAVRDELLRKGIAESVTWATSPATSPGWHRDVDEWPGKRPGETVNMGRISISTGYFTTLGMTMKEGRDFSGPDDTLNVIFNQAAVRLLRLKNPLHQVITNWNTKLQIVGIVKDALTISPYAPADPTIFLYDAKPQGAMMYRLSPHIPTREAIARLTAVFNKYNPAFPYEYRFADDTFAATYATEMLIGKLAALVAVLAIFTSCLGLFGLAAYMAEQRNREIGIRKVLGASISQLWLLLSKEFIALVVISCLIASPVAWYFLNRWLHSYANRIDIGAGVFVVATVMAIVITVVTISFQSIRAATMNPTKSLRTEG
jgi:putative ABC transport system permease protein